MNRWKSVLVGSLTVIGLIGLLVALAVWTRPVRHSVKTYTALITAANQSDIPAALALCSKRYQQREDLKLAPEGGIIGLPRNIHKNFQAWRQGPFVWLCPTNRAGPVYQFIKEDGAWKFDGPVGLLRGRGEFVPMPGVSLTDEDAAESLDSSSPLH